MLRKEGLQNVPQRRLHVQYLLRGHPLDHVMKIQRELRALRAKQMARNERLAQVGSGSGGGKSILDQEEDGDEFALPAARRTSRRRHDEL